LWGDRYGKLTDPFGHNWSLATHKEDLTSQQVAERMKTAGL
jgi:PhnB protein